MNPSLVQKYNVPGPRYTSYPTVPYWDKDSFRSKKWEESVRNSFLESNENEGISLYIHLPFCEQMCTFCGCNKRITKNHSVEKPYINSVLKEWSMYNQLFSERPVIKELHLGGGTPTFFSPENLELLLKGIFYGSKKHQDIQLSFEGHPNNTSPEHLEILSNYGFKRVSFGVQDYNKTVQKAINRIQPFENVETVTKSSRDNGYESVSHDIIFGLPFQTKNDIINTIEKTNKLRPDRIAFYSYAHTPWIKGNGQRGFKDSDLPSGKEKREQYEIGKNLLLDAGYVEIGMDHFALKTDSLYKSYTNGTLHRNFMGYTSSKTKLLIGLGVSSISDSWYGFSQNVKSLEEYSHLLENNIFPIYRGHILNEEDLEVKQHILNLMCQFETSWNESSVIKDELNSILSNLEEMKADGLINTHNDSIKITEKGKPYVRNICMAFDLRLQRNQPDRELFSMTV